jgi:prepilin-type N-terminal cleavage/methylation domain-containing protein
MNATHARRRAFSMVELIVVITIIAILVGIGVPALSSAADSADRSLAADQLRAGLAAARSAAVRSGAGDAAAVFFYDIPRVGEGRLSVLACVKVGEMRDGVVPQQFEGVVREVFVPIAEVKPVHLPAGWMVRAFAPAGTLSDDQGVVNGWYDTPTDAPASAREFDPRAGNWVFPETAFFTSPANAATADPNTLAAQGGKRQTFMVRFKAGTGELDQNNPALALVVAPVPTPVGAADWRRQITTQTTAKRIDEASDLPRFVKSLLEPRDFDGNGRVDGNDQAAVSAAIGEFATDAVLARGVSEIVLYNERSLSRAVANGRVNRATGSLYGDPADPARVPTGAAYDTSLFESAPATTIDISERINAWLEGRYERNRRAIESDARMFVVPRFQSELTEIRP